MESTRAKSSLTDAQQRAVAARGNVLVMAGAGTGKTHTLVERCLDLLRKEHVSLDEILVITFTEAAATEMRQRLRAALENSLDAPSGTDPFLAEQLALFDTAHLGTLHSFCLKLVREHFHELGLDPQLAVLAAGEARLLAQETLDAELSDRYAGETESDGAVQKLIQNYGGGRDEKVRALVLRLHHYAQTRPDAEGWLAQQIGTFDSPTPEEWPKWLQSGIRDWRDEWLPVLERLRTENIKAGECLEVLETLPEKFSREQAASILNEIQSAATVWPKGQKGGLKKLLEKFLAEAAFLNSLAPKAEGRDPLVEDWDWVRGHMTALLRLTRNFSERFTARKRDDGVLDFHDLEQFALRLLWNFKTGKPTAIAERWRGKLRFVFVDEYQDINAAQDQIIQALSRDDAQANRFLVGDVKQSIYRFRLADPKIFRDYAKNWRGKNGQTIPLTENFRSRESLLDFVNSAFALLMRAEIGGVNYDDEAKLKFGSPETRAESSPAKNSAPRTELLLRRSKGRPGLETGGESDPNDPADQTETEKEARLLALRLKKLQAGRQAIWDREEKTFRAVEWRDVAILLRAPSGKSEIYAKEFERAGVPLTVERGGFYDSREILDLLSLLQLLDNPLQDVPAIAVLRSPLVGLSLDELAQIRLAVRHEHFWTALESRQQSAVGSQNEAAKKISKFREGFARWRKLAQQASLSQCLESVLAETHYAEWLRSRPGGPQRAANVGRFLNLAQKFDRFQRQGLFRFLKFIATQREAEVEPEVAAVAEENAVRLMSIHQSKGLEFPVVAIADLAKPFNEQDGRNEIIFDEELGLCPRVKPPHTGRRYPSLPHWLAQRRQRREQAGEELRLLYVAMTRARDTLILTGSVTEKKWETLWSETGVVTPQKIVSAKSYADWLGLWFAQQNGARAGMEGELPNLGWRLAEDTELAGESVTEKTETQRELPSMDDATKRKLQEVLTWEYGFAAATKRKAKSSVTALRREASEWDDEAEQIFPARRSVRTKLSAADAGTAHHKFLEHVSLDAVGEPAALAAEAKRLEREKVLSMEERAALDLNNVAAFWNSAAGNKIRRQAAEVERELPFTVKFRPKELDEILGTKSGTGLEKEFVVVQGVADLVVLLPKEIWLVDFKTDRMNDGDLSKKERDYRKQLKLYASALSKIYGRPVTNCWLHFLAAQRTVKI
ncbi:MAG TPA: UvrD-helicase domain-containing protein [Verrucomicrobiae bacterium]